MTSSRGPDNPGRYGAISEQIHHSPLFNPTHREPPIASSSMPQHELLTGQKVRRRDITCPRRSLHRPRPRAPLQSTKASSCHSSSHHGIDSTHRIAISSQSYRRYSRLPYEFGLLYWLKQRFQPCFLHCHFLGSPISWRAGSFGGRFYPGSSPAGQLLSSFE